MLASKYKNITEFLNEILMSRMDGPSIITNLQRRSNIKDKLTIDGACSAIRYAEDSDFIDEVDTESNWETDHDHSAWTNRHIIKVVDEDKERFFEAFLCYYGQYELDEDGTESYEVTEVFPKIITKIIYEK